MENYFNYFTEIEEHFLQRRGGGLLLSTLDWALIETWKDAGIPLEAALRGIDAAFDHYDQRPVENEEGQQPRLLFAGSTGSSGRYERGSGQAADATKPAERPEAKGFEAETVAAFLRQNADLLEAAKLPAGPASALRRSCAKPQHICASWLTNVARKPASAWKTWSVV